MKTIKALFLSLVVMALLVAPLAFTASPATAEPIYVCLPTCEDNDARFFTVAGSGMATMADEAIHLQIAAPASADSFELGFFDGDTGGTWDYGTTELEFILYADPSASGNQDTLIKQWSGNAMPDNDWFKTSVPTSSEAKSLGGDYFYHLYIHPTSTGMLYASNFKVRTDGILVTVRPSIFAFMAPLYSWADVYHVYPNWPELTSTYYDGNFNFYVYSPTSATYFSEWDGDLDYGSYDQTSMDTDDPDTPNDTLPVWADGTSAAVEGVATGYNGSTGGPPDDYNTAVFRRIPSVIYSITDPDGNIYQNDNPSGNLEWEQYRIDSDPSSPADEYSENILPSGLYRISLEGMDLGNLNAWRFSHTMVGVCSLASGGIPTPCKTLLFPYMIGDTVFVDTNGNGVQDTDEPGIPNVTLYLLDSNGKMIQDIFGEPVIAITDEAGHYAFKVEGQRFDPDTEETLNDGIYTVRIAPLNFNPGAPLENMVSTTGGDQQTNTVINQNVDTYDFGFRIPVPDPPLNPGTGTIGYWKNHPESWPVTSITIGSVTYTRDQAIALMKAKGKGDKTYDLFAQLVVAKLNILIGNDSTCISTDIAAADAWLAVHPVGSNVKASSVAWKQIEAAFTNLDSYNNGQLCAPHRG
ncbi:MAG: SdrD B-like domain-containing protein [Chloroflexota bacterium]